MKIAIADLRAALNAAIAEINGTILDQRQTRGIQVQMPEFLDVTVDLVSGFNVIQRSSTGSDTETKDLVDITGVQNDLETRNLQDTMPATTETETLNTADNTPQTTETTTSPVEQTTTLRSGEGSLIEVSQIDYDFIVSGG